MMEYAPYIIAPIGSMVLYGLARMLISAFKRKR